MERSNDTAPGESTPDAAAQSTFDLHIHFTGLCLLVEDFYRRDGEKRLHALMPPTGGSGHDSPGHVHQHLSRLLYDYRYETKGVVEDPARANDPKEARRIEMENRALDFSVLETTTEFTSSFEVDMSNYSVFDLSKFVAPGSSNPHIGQVPRKLLDSSDTHGEVVSRVTVRAGEVAGGDPGVRWNIGGKGPEHMAVAVEWVIRSVAGESLKLNFKGLNNNVPYTFNPVDLYPIGGEIHLWFVHSPDQQIPMEVPVKRIPGKPADLEASHFNAFYGLLGGPIPVFVDEGRRSAGGEANVGREGEAGGSDHPEHVGRHAPHGDVAPTAAASGGSDASCIATRARAVPG